MRRSSTYCATRCVRPGACRKSAKTRRRRSDEYPLELSGSRNQGSIVRNDDDGARPGRVESARTTGVGTGVVGTVRGGRFHPYVPQETRLAFARLTLTTEHDMLHLLRLIE